MANIMDSVFPHGIPKCTDDGEVFPWHFTAQARAMTGDYGLDYESLKDTITSCMLDLGMKLPNDLDLYTSGG